MNGDANASLSDDMSGVKGSVSIGIVVHNTPQVLYLT